MCHTQGTNRHLKAYWIATILGPGSFIIGGIMFLTHADRLVLAMDHMGLSPDLLTIVGVWNILGAMVCIAPNMLLLKEWAYAGFIFELTGSAALHALAGDPLFSFGPNMIAPPLLFLMPVIASYLLRPPARRPLIPYIRTSNV